MNQSISLEGFLQIASELRDLIDQCQETQVTLGVLADRDDIDVSIEALSKPQVLWLKNDTMVAWRELNAAQKAVVECSDRYHKEWDVLTALGVLPARPSWRN